MLAKKSPRVNLSGADTWCASGTGVAPKASWTLSPSKGQSLVFVEVRTRRGDRFGTPEESITPAKRAHLIAAAQAYLQAHSLEDRDWRIDVVAVEMSSRGELVRVDVIENAIEGDS